MIERFFQMHRLKLNANCITYPNLKQAAGWINFYVNANKIEFMCFKEERAIFTLRGKPLNLVDQFTYLSSNISSTESDVNILLTKALAAIDRLLIVCKSDLSD